MNLMLYHVATINLCIKYENHFRIEVNRKFDIQVYRYIIFFLNIIIIFIFFLMKKKHCLKY